MKNLFNFKTTNTGWTFLLRNFLVAFAGEINAELCEINAIFFLLFIPIVWFALANMSQRINAVMPKEKVLAWILLFIPVLGSVMGFYLTVANGNKKDK